MTVLYVCPAPLPGPTLAVVTLEDSAGRSWDLAEQDVPDGVPGTVAAAKRTHIVTLAV